jgi:hypothetical protein
VSAVARRPHRVLPDRFVKSIRDLHRRDASAPDIEPMAWLEVLNSDASEVST